MNVKEVINIAKPKYETINIDEYFETMLICAERYALGRQTYIVKEVIDYITSLLPKLTERPLATMQRDLETANYYGDENIDEPAWKKFLADIRWERRKRGDINEI